MLEARSLKKAVVPSTLIHHPSPANLHSNRLSLHVSEDGASCWVYVASDCNVYRILITGISFSSVDPNYAYIQGVDYEVFCGQWKENKKTFSFRGDSNWLGFSKCQKRDVLGGWCDSGSVFVADVVQGIEM